MTEKAIVLQLVLEEVRVLRGALEVFVMSMEASPGTAIWMPGMEEAAHSVKPKLDEAIRIAAGGRPGEVGTCA